MKSYGMYFGVSFCTRTANSGSLGVTAYRFSISWARIIPLGGRKDAIETRGVQWYSEFIDKLLEAGITPFVTLFHWDMPLALYERYGGMLNTEEFTQDFKRYSEVCFDFFGDRVKHWITFNEPVVVAQLVSFFTSQVTAMSKNNSDML